MPCYLLEVRRELTEQRFRWASCQLDSLRKCLRPATVRKTLSTLPSTLDETYERILLNIDGQYKQEAQLALTWLVASRRVLTVEELAEAVSIETDSEGLFDPSNRLFEPNTICSVLSGLVSIVQRHTPRESADVRLAHFSVEEYLVSDRLAKSRASQFHISFEMSHIRLAAASLIYLQWAKDFLRQDTGHPIWSFSEVVRGGQVVGRPWVGGLSDQFAINLAEKTPLLDYACRSWYLHVRICEGYLPEREIRLVENFLECRERIAFFEIVTYDGFDDAADEGCHSSRHALLRKSFSGMKRTEPNFIASPLFHAARLGLVDVVTALLKRTNRSHVLLHPPMHQPLTPGSLGDELRIACFYRHEKVVEILLNAGADVEAVGGGFKTALGASMNSITPDPVIIQMLLERVEKVHPDVDWIVGWALRWAAMEGHLPVVSTLMSKTSCVGPEKYTWTHEYLRFPVWRALVSSNGRKDILYESYPKRGTAPYEAASAGHHEVLSLLISNWSNIDEEDHEGRTSLYWAAFKGHTETVKLLLENGARTYGHRCVHEWTPAYWARMRGFHEIEDLLVHIDRTTTRGRRAEPQRISQTEM